MQHRLMTLLHFQVKIGKAQLSQLPMVLREEYLFSSPSFDPTFHAGPDHTQQDLTVLCQSVLNYTGSQKAPHITLLENFHGP